MVIRILWGAAALALVVALTLYVIAHGGPSLAIVIVFALFPDVALVGAFDPAQRGMLKANRVAFYNALHRPWIALGLITWGALAALPAFSTRGGGLLLCAGLAWFIHIGIDRAAGYGLRDRHGAIRPVGGTATATMCQA